MRCGPRCASMMWVLLAVAGLTATRGASPALGEGGRPAPCPTVIPCPPPCVSSPPVPPATPVPPPAKPETKPEATKEVEPAPAPSPAPVVAPEVMSVPSMDTGERLSLFDSSVGYIDPAIPMGQVRLRFDTAYDSNRPTRAEFFYPRGPNPGPPTPDTHIDYQELTTYLEMPFRPTLSAFVEAPWRFVNPLINLNTAGFSDLTFGFKWAFQYENDRVTSFQLRTYVPTGDADRRLGTNHVSLEPALLAFRRLSDRLRLESELRYWQPIGGTDFAGSIIRYGVGLSWGERPPCRAWINPVAEVVGWTVLYGKESIFPPSPPFTADAAGDTIVNLKLGLRAGMGNRWDAYFGYGRPLTGEVWYNDIYRFELRLLF